MQNVIKFLTVLTFVGASTLSQARIEETEISVPCSTDKYRPTEVTYAANPKWTYSLSTIGIRVVKPGKDFMVSCWPQYEDSDENLDDDSAHAHVEAKCDILSSQQNAVAVINNDDETKKNGDSTGMGVDCKKGEPLQVMMYNPKCLAGATNKYYYKAKLIKVIDEDAAQANAPQTVSSTRVLNGVANLNAVNVSSTIDRAPAAAATNPAPVKNSGGCSCSVM